MRKLTTRLFLINILVAFAISSCATNFTAGYTSVPVENPVFKTPYFSNPETDYVYKTNITVYGHDLSGIFVAKKIRDGVHRVVFTTEFGNKLLDFEISDTDFKVNYIVEELNRKILIKTLKNDFQLLLRDEFEVAEAYKKDGITVLKSADGDRFNYLYLSQDGKKLNKIIQTSVRKEKLNITYISENNTFADKIIILHNDMKLRIEFNHFKIPTE
ncbi:MAG TPA: hypothetical protein VGB50_08055 [Flavobacterium sp.]|jgi:hypothetical protein